VVLPASGRVTLDQMKSSLLDANLARSHPDGIRAQLRKWEELYGSVDPLADFKIEGETAQDDGPANSTHLPKVAGVRPLMSTNDDSVSYDKAALSRKESEDNVGSDEVRMLQPGDLAELEVHQSGKSIPAVHVRPVGEWGVTGQFINIYGRTSYAPYNMVPWHSRQWMDPKLIKPLVPYLPDIQTESQILEVKEIAVFEDLAVPRNVSGPIIARLNALSEEIDEIYRRNSDTLDRAHEILAHPTDLRYGSLSSITRALLDLKESEVTPAALCAVRRALINAGVAFHMDKMQHRISGYVQILSKQDVKSIEYVQGWMRSWQDYVAIKDKSKKPKPLGATIIDTFINKAKAIVLRSRAQREPAHDSAIGPCKIQTPITESQGCVEEKFHPVFDAREQAIIKFLFEWAATRRFTRDQSLSSLPPILMHGTGLFNDVVADVSEGYRFLQELGVVGQHHGRHSFNPDLLLPTSGQSRPLSLLKDKLDRMGDEEVNLPDAMKHLRHDWGDLPIFCIDDAGAAEIDDGISVESAGVGNDGKPEYWFHVHVANPTAFFDRDHPIAKMARHMGETVYTPEHAHSMLPKWLTQRYLSLGKDRPVITFSARIDEAGNTLEHRIRNGTARNVFQFTYDDLDRLLDSRAKAMPQAVLSTGELPPASPTKNDFDNMTPELVGQLKLMDQLSRARMSVRASKGGQFYHQPLPSPAVRGYADRSGLGPSVPYFEGARTTQGDPVITMRASGFSNPFNENARPSDVVVREAMLLACEIGAKWCAERQIPALFRGTIPHPRFPNPEKYLQEHVLTKVGEDGVYPRIEGRKYVQMLGYGVIRTTPVNHGFLGMDAYVKATSPLRRYGDMVLHWQIEAALRHEAETGVSLVVAGTPNPSLDRSFLPLAAQALEPMIPGIQAREHTVRLTKRRSEEHWARMLLWRKHYYPELSGGPITNVFPKLHIVIELGADEMLTSADKRGIILEFALKTRIAVNPDLEAAGIEQPMPGEIWECELCLILINANLTYVKPIRRVKENASEDYTSWRSGPLLEEASP
jgi:hypothetical protein